MDDEAHPQPSEFFATADERIDEPDPALSEFFTKFEGVCSSLTRECSYVAGADAEESGPNSRTLDVIEPPVPQGHSSSADSNL